MVSESWAGRSRMEATFLGVVDLQLSWPSFPTPTHLDVVDIRDVSVDGLGNINYRVAVSEELVGEMIEELDRPTAQTN